MSQYPNVRGATAEFLRRCIEFDWVHDAAVPTYAAKERADLRAAMRLFAVEFWLVFPWRAAGEAFLNRMADRCQDGPTGEVQREAIAARARGDFAAERRALDRLALDERAAAASPPRFPDPPEGMRWVHPADGKHTEADGDRFDCGHWVLAAADHREG